MKFIRLLLLTCLTSSSVHVLTDAALQIKVNGIHSHRGTQGAASHEISRGKRAVNNVSWDGETAETRDHASLYYPNTTLDAAAEGLGKTRSRRAVQCAKRMLPRTCATNMDCSSVTCNLLFARKQGSVTFKVNNCRPPSMTARIQVPSLKINWSHTFTSKRQPPVLIPEFSYDVGVMQGGVFLKARLLKKKAGNKLTAKVRVLVGGRIPKVSSYLIGTKLLYLSLLAKGKNCGKMPPSASGKGPCANMKLSQFCKISSDCLKINCAIRFAGQKVALAFGINKCDNPISLTAGITVSALNVHWKHKIKGGAMLPIPGFGVNVGVMKAGVFIVVGLRPKGNKLALQIRLKAGASVPFVGKVYPLKITLLKVKLPIKIKGCGQMAAQFMDTPNLSQISSTLPSPSQTQLPPDDSSVDDRMDPRDEPSMYGGQEISHEESVHGARGNRYFQEYQELGPDDPIMLEPSISQPYGANDKSSPLQDPPGGAASYDTWEDQRPIRSRVSKNYEEY